MWEMPEVPDFIVEYEASDIRSGAIVLELFIGGMGHGGPVGETFLYVCKDIASIADTCDRITWGYMQLYPEVVISRISEYLKVDHDLDDDDVIYTWVDDLRSSLAKLNKRQKDNITSRSLKAIEELLSFFPVGSIEDIYLLPSEIDHSLWWFNSALLETETERFRLPGDEALVANLINRRNAAPFMQ
jgi:hypothetical protein